jgi:phosphohistidine phosphatase
MAGMGESERRHGGRGPVDLLVVRHAHAGDPAVWRGPDDARPLSTRGENQVARLVALLQRTGVRPNLILTSPKLRATQTATPIGEALGVPVRVEPLLGLSVDLLDLERMLASAGDPPSAMVVGHDPDFTELVEELTGASSLPVAKGGIVRLECARPLVPGSGVLHWLVPPDLMKDL